VFESDLAPDQIGVRKHGARTITDPKGCMKITVRAAENLIRYRFGLKTADYLVCGRCGVYVATSRRFRERHTGSRACTQRRRIDRG